MLLVIYDNNMFRLWNMLDGRCLFKRKLAVDEEDTNKVTHKALQVKWEPTEGNLYAILYDKKLEVFKADNDKPLSTVTTDVAFNCMEFVSGNEIITSDVQGKLTFVKNIEDEEKTTITLINTKVTRFREIKSVPRSNVLVGVATEGKICFYDVEQLRKFHIEVGNAKPIKQIKSKSRFLCLAINHMTPEQAKPKKINKKKTKKTLGKKISKDEKKIL